MATSSIPLAKGMDLSKMEWPAFLSIKHDGVPVKLTVTVYQGTFQWDVVSRSGKPVPSVRVYCEEIAYNLCNIPTIEDGVFTIVAEVTHRWEKDFKDVAGIIRKKTAQPFLIWNVFDFTVDWANDQPFSARTAAVYGLIQELDLPYLKYVGQKEVISVSHAEDTLAFLQRYMPSAEGFIIASAARTFKPNSRHWDYQKIVVDPVHDLFVHSYEEAVSKDGKPLGMVGRINVLWYGERTGCGPGKMTHAERRSEWAQYGAGPHFCEEQGSSGRIASIKAKRDPSYDKMRQPTFQCWRPEKTDESYG